MFNGSTMPFMMNVEPAGTCRNNDGGFGGDGWGAWIWVILLFALIGWGGNGFGGFGGGNGTLAATETQATLQRGFDNQNVISKLDGLTQGLCDSTYALNNSITNGFHGVDNAICNLGYQTQQGFNQTNVALMQGQNALSNQLASCCCNIERGIDGVNYNLATQSCDTRNTIQNTTRDIIDAVNCGNRQLMDFLVNDKISTLTAENQSLKFAASQAQQNAYLTANQEAQTAELIRRIAPYPVPAFSVPNPYGFGYGYGYGYGNGNGCNNCCA